MKIILVMQAFQLGGSEQVAVNLAIGLAKKGHKCCVLAIRKPSSQSDTGDELKTRLSKHEVEFFEFGGPNNRINALYCPLQLRNFFRKWQPDIVHSHGEISDFMLSLTSRLLPLMTVRTVHGTVLWPTHHLMGWVSESGFRDELTVLISDGASDAYDQLRIRYRLPTSRHQVNIPNGIPLANEVPVFSYLDLVKQIRTEKRKYHFCFAGRFTPQKGFDVLLDALEKMPDSCREKIQIYAFGDGEELELCKMRVIEKRLPVVIHPAVAGIQGIFPEFDAVIMPSRFEGLPLVPLEAFACGVPVIGTRAPGLIETYPPDWPLTVPIEDSEALSRLIIKFMDGAFDIKQLKKIAKIWGEQFTISRMVDAHEKAYQEYLISSSKK